jgi:hypothetical protein
MSEMIPWLTFCVLFALMCVLTPRIARIFTGVFFIVMAIAVNWVVAIVAPDLFVGLGTDAPLLGLYEWVFGDIVALAPQLVGIVTGIGEVALGVLMLSRGRWVTLGLAGGVAFLLLITPVGLWTLPNPIMAAGLAFLMSKRFERSLPDIVRIRTRRARTALRRGLDRPGAQERDRAIGAGR